MAAMGVIRRFPRYCPRKVFGPHHAPYRRGNAHQSPDYPHIGGPASTRQRANSARVSCFGHTHSSLASLQLAVDRRNDVPKKRPQRGERLGPSWGVPRAARHDSLNRKSGGLFPLSARGFIRGAVTDSERSFRGRWPVRRAGYRRASFRRASHHSMQASHAGSRDNRRAIDTILRN
jgi:hypothetical protein